MRKLASPRLNTPRFTTLVALVAFSTWWATPLAADTALPQTRHRQGLELPKPLALTQDPPVIGRQLNSTAFFVDDTGYLVTARHGVENCTRLIVTKEQHRVFARLVARSPNYDIALLKIPRTLGIAAVFPHSLATSNNDMVFAGAYDTLPWQMTAGVIANSRIGSTGGAAPPGHIVIDSPATFGASGAPVLDSNGLVRGVVSRRQESKVTAVNVAEVKAFLTRNNVQFEEDDRPQIASMAPRAQRANSISAHVICLQD